MSQKDVNKDISTKRAYKKPVLNQDCGAVAGL